MEKDRKYNIVLGIMIFLFILVIGICIAWGLGYIGITKTNSEVEKNGITIDEVIVNSDTKEDVKDMSEDTTESEQKVNNEKTEEMTEELAYGILNKYKVENLPDAKWYITKVTLVAHGDNNSYWVAYDAINYSADIPYEDGAGTIIEYKDGEWVTNLPGFTSISDDVVSKYNFVNY